MAVLDDGTPIDTTDALEALIGDVLQARYAHEDTFGVCPSE